MADARSGLSHHWECGWDNNGDVHYDLGNDASSGFNMICYGDNSGYANDPWERVNRAVSLTSDYLYTTGSSTTGYTDWTLSMWFYISSGTSAAIFSDYYNGSRIYYDTGVIYVNINGYSDSFSYTLSTGTWYHLAFCIDDSANNVKTYINGVLVRNDTDTGSPNITADYRWYFGWDGGSRYLNGRLYDIRIYNRILSRDDVWLLYTRAYQYQRTGFGNWLEDHSIISYWDMRDDATGFNDLVGSNNLTANNGAGGAYTDRFGKSGGNYGAITASSTENWTTSSQPTDNPITLCLWHYAASSSTHAAQVFGSRWDSYFSGYQHMHISYQYRYFGDNTNFSHFWGSGGAWTANTWNFFVVAKSGTTARFFLNGNYYTQNSSSFQNGTNNVTKLWMIGNNSNSGTVSMNGALGEIFWFSEYMADAAVKELYEMTKNSYLSYKQPMPGGVQCRVC